MIRAWMKEIEKHLLRIIHLISWLVAEDDSIMRNWNIYNARLWSKLVVGAPDSPFLTVYLDINNWEWNDLCRLSWSSMSYWIILKTQYKKTNNLWSISQTYYLSISVSYHSYEQGLSFKAFDWSASFSTFILLGWQMKLTPCFSLLLLGFLSSVPGKKDHDGRHQHHQQLQQPSKNSWLLWIWLDCFCSCICGTCVEQMTSCLLLNF